MAADDQQDRRKLRARFDAAFDPAARVRDAGLNPFLEQFPATLWATDRDMRLTFVEGQLFERLGVTHNAVVGRTLVDLLLDGREDHPLVQGHLTALAGCETSVRVEWGGEIYSARIAPLRDDEGDVIGCVGVNLITAWVPEPGETLRESDVRLQRVIDTSVMGIVFVNAEGISDANDAFLEITGHSVEDLTTGEIHWTDLMPLERQQEHLQRVTELQQTGRVDPHETQLQRKDGSLVDVIVSAVRLSARRREAVGFLLDITSQKRESRRAAAEVACAKLLIGAVDADEAIPAWLHLVCDTLSWDGAALWRAQIGQHASVDALCEPVVHGVGTSHVSAMTPFAARTLASGASVPAESVAALLLPLLPDGPGGVCLGVIAFTRPSGPAPDAALMKTMESVADQAAQFLRRA